MNEKPTIVRVEIGGVSTLARVVLWYYIAKSTFAVVKVTLKYLVAAVVAVLVGVWLAYALTTPPRPFYLDEFDPYLESAKSLLESIKISPHQPLAAPLPQIQQP